MKKICLVIPKYLQKNEVFNIESPLNRDGIFDKYIKLKSEFRKHNWNLSTDDINTIEVSDVVLYFDMPKTLPSKNKINCSYLILVESSLIRPDNYEFEKHSYFKRIFTWNDELVDNNRYFKLNFSHLFPPNIKVDVKNKDKLCILVSGNKKTPSHNINELYSKRVDAIKWFESNQADKFDLFGVGWGKRRFEGPILLRALNRVPFLCELFAILTGQVYPSYRGVIKNKKIVMENYKFSICYENVKDIPGYITEKIFDSFFAGCVPIYWGANNVSKHIPSNCFVDKRDFQSYEELFDFISNIDDEKYIDYMNNIQNFLNSEDGFKFTGQNFAEVVVCNVLKDF
ncbi:hypothetical protein FM037_09975 [Shewanella psychropiezotolerans]|uniref:Fucosyltransferase C-terminal domain-containing protein n=1 Tax=Shewanella psychropiezotolerans TaxID=2593655 RepID=A0ABX5WWP1_9GAMM|nr:glycosyltransferase family 10 [Shewanella psychropiezotolerans]QDO83505.1 hypothetical protein FM037_09975 [Shewanella psychropiezotolerans]